MELNNIKTNGTWSAIAADLNQNFLKILTELLKYQHITTISGANFLGYFTSSSSLPTTDEAAWAIAGNLKSVTVYAYYTSDALPNGFVEGWNALSSLGTYDFTNYSVLLSEIEETNETVTELASEVDNLKRNPNIEIVNNLTEGGSDKALSAEMGLILGRDIYGSNDEEIINITHNDLTNDEYFQPQGQTRGSVAFRIKGDYNITISVKDNSPLKYVLHTTNEPETWTSILSDSGWLTSSMSKSYDNSFGNGNYLRISCAYSAGYNRVPTFDEFVENLSFTLTCANVDYRFGVVNHVDKLYQSLSELQKEVDNTNGILRDLKSESTVEGLGTKNVDVSVLPEYTGSLGSTGNWFVDGEAGKHKPVSLEGVKKIKLIADTKTFIAFVSIAYIIGDKANGGKVPYCSTTSSRITIQANTVYESDVPEDAAYLILTSVDGAGLIIDYTSLVLYTDVKYLKEEVFDNKQKIEDLSKDIDKLSDVLYEGVNVPEMSIIKGMAITPRNGAYERTGYELIDYIDVSNFKKIRIKSGFWKDDIAPDSTVIEFSDSGKNVIKTILPSDILGITSIRFAYIFDGFVDVPEGAFYVRFCNLVYIPSTNRNTEFEPVDASITQVLPKVYTNYVVDKKLGRTQQDINEDVKNTLFGKSDTLLVDKFTQEDIVENSYYSATAGGGRGYIIIKITEYDEFKLKVSVAADSTVKAACVIKQSLNYSDNIYDSGWIAVGGSHEISNETATNGKGIAVSVVFTNTSGSGQPSVESIKQFVTIDFEGTILANNGLVNKVKEIGKAVLPEEYGGYAYQGEKLRLKDNFFTAEIVGTLSGGVSSRQGGAVFGDYLFQFHNTLQTIVVYNLKNNENVQTLSLTPNSNHHAGSGGFGNEYYNSADMFPLLYISSMNEKKVYAYRIFGTVEGSWSIEQVQTITLDVKGLYIPNIAIDRENNMAVVFGYTKASWSDSSNNTSVITSFELPKLSDGDVTVTEFAEQKIMPFIYAQQGAFARMGKLYLSYGNTAVTPWYGGAYVIDYIQGVILSNMPFLPMGSFEPEAFCLYEGNIVMTDQNGKIYKLTF